MIPEDDALTELSLVVTDLAIIVTFVSMALTIAIVVYAIIRAAHFQPQGMLVIVMAVIAIVGLFLYALSRVTEVLTISATAVGALAGALTSLFKERPESGGSTGSGPQVRSDDSGAPGPSEEPAEDKED